MLVASWIFSSSRSLTLYKFGMTPTATGVCSHYVNGNAIIGASAETAYVCSFDLVSSVLPVSPTCLTTPTWNFVHHTLDLLYLKFSLNLSEKASQSALGRESCLDPNSSTRPLCGFTPLMYSRHNVFGF